MEYNRLMHAAEEAEDDLQSNYELRRQRRVLQDAVAAITPLNLA